MEKMAQSSWASDAYQFCVWQSVSFKQSESCGGVRPKHSNLCSVGLLKLTQPQTPAVSVDSEVLQGQHCVNMSQFSQIELMQRQDFLCIAMCIRIHARPTELEQFQKSMSYVASHVVKPLLSAHSESSTLQQLRKQFHPLC